MVINSSDMVRRPETNSSSWEHQRGTIRTDIRTPNAPGDGTPYHPIAPGHSAEPHPPSTPYEPGHDHWTPPRNPPSYS